MRPSASRLLPEIEVAQDQPGGFERTTAVSKSARMPGQRQRPVSFASRRSRRSQLPRASGVGITLAGRCIHSLSQSLQTAFVHDARVCQPGCQIHKLRCRECLKLLHGTLPKLHHSPVLLAAHTRTVKQAAQVCNRLGSERTGSSKNLILKECGKPVAHVTSPKHLKERISCKLLSLPGLPVGSCRRACA